jgi:palmitoyltransferase
MVKQKKYYGTHNGNKYWVNLEPCGLFCGLVSWFIILFGMYAVTIDVIKPWLGFSVFGIFNVILYNFLSIMTIYSHFLTMTSDPGSVPFDALPLLDDQQEKDVEAAIELESNLDIDPIHTTRKYKKWCKKCNAFKPKRSHHCSICGRCIIKMDHHCPWVNNCIGIGNHKLFLLFLLWVNIVCIYAFLLIISKCILCKYANGCGEEHESVTVLILLTTSILFALFTVCMIGDQIAVIATNLTQIDRLKNIKSSKDTINLEYNEVFGCSSEVSFHYTWLIPQVVQFPDVYRDILLGYRLLSNTAKDMELTPLTSCIDTRDGDISDIDNNRILNTNDVNVKDSLMLGSNSSSLSLGILNNNNNNHDQENSEILQDNNDDNDNKNDDNNKNNLINPLHSLIIPTDSFNGGNNNNVDVVTTPTIRKRSPV